MRNLVIGVLLTLAALAGVAAWLWYRAPEHLPAEWRRQNPQARDYAPTVYRWKDDQGRTQVSDTPPADRAYETVTIDPDTNIVPSLLPDDPSDD